jgi:hypothetical protein
MDGSDYKSIGRVYHLTHIDNIRSISTVGLLCKEALEKQRIKYSDISDPGPQNKRQGKFVDIEWLIPLHNYVPFYIAHLNAMTYKVVRKYGSENLCFLCMNSEKLKDFERNHRKNVHISYGNAASSQADFKPLKDLDSEMLKGLMENIRKARDWSKDDAKKKLRCTEVLFPFEVKLKYIDEIVVSTRESYEKVRKQLVTTTPVKIDSAFFKDFNEGKKEDDIIF